MTEDDRVEELRTREPGEDESAYEDIDLSDLPEWWRRNIEEHDEYGLRPYRPPRFADGVIVPSLLDDLRKRFDVDVELVGRNATYGDDWSVHVAGSPAFDISRHRDPDGYTIIEQSSDSFIEAVEEAVDGSG